MTNDIYSDIASRTDGDIYIGVVGPVRTGKSTFIKRFMESLVIPNIESDFKRERAVDELPQSAAGKTIMTTEPKFIPEEAVEVNLGDGPHHHDSRAQVRAGRGSGGDFGGRCHLLRPAHRLRWVHSSQLNRLYRKFCSENGPDAVV